MNQSVEEIKMTKNIISKVESFIAAYMGGDMSQKELIISTIKEELSEHGKSELSKSVGLDYYDENNLMFGNLFKPGRSVLTGLRSVKRQIMSIHNKHEAAGIIEFRKIHHTFCGIEFGKVVGKFNDEEDMWELVDEFENIILDAVMMAKNDTGYAGFYLLCNSRYLDKICKIIEGR